MKTITYLKMLTLSVICGLFVISCQKAANAPGAPVQSQRQTQLMNATNDMFTQSTLEDEDFAIITGRDNVQQGNTSGLTNCRTVTYVPADRSYPYTKTVDYGAGCVLPDGHFRKGQMIVKYLVDPSTASPGTQLTETSYNGYSVDNNNITGLIRTYLVASNPYTISAWSAKNVSNSTSGNDKAWLSNVMWTQIAGQETIDPADDVFQITGNSAGLQQLNGATNMAFTSSISSSNPLIKPASCEYRTQGSVNSTIEIFTGGLATFQEVLDYGSGTCDDAATLTINGGIPQNVSLPLSYWPLSL